MLVSTNHGTLIVNQNDYKMVDQQNAVGVGVQLMASSCMDPQEIDLALTLIGTRRENFGDGVATIDCGANIGVHTVEWARLMTGWGHVYAFEAQEKIYYALAGNIVINNCLNVTARHAAVGAECGELLIPEPNYLVPGSYGSFSLVKGENTEFIGQDIDYANANTVVDLVSIDSLGLSRLDFLKIDVEGMELDVLAGADRALRELKPQILVEVLKSDGDKIARVLEGNGYSLYPMGLNLLAIHASDPVRSRLRMQGGILSFS